MPCPLCGGLLHPVAGRCKHCKQDLTNHRQRVPDAGGGQLPRLAAGTAPLNGTPNGSPNGSMNGSTGMLHGPQAAATIGLGAPAYAVDGVRPPAGRGWLRNWPLLVILLAVIGMIVALILLVLPQRHASVRRGAKPLSNDNMQTDVVPGSGKSSAIDPWNSSPPRPPRDRVPQPPPQPPPPAPAPDPSANPGADLDTDPSVPDLMEEDDEDADAQGGVVGGTISGSASGSTGPDPSVDLGIVEPDEISPLDSLMDPSQSAEMTSESVMAMHACARAAVCDGEAARAARCSRMLRPQPRSTPRPQRCRNIGMAMRCVQAIDALPCDIPPTMRSVLRIPFCLQQVGC